MRKVFVILMAGASLVLTSCKNKMKINEKLVPEAVSHTFHTRYPKADKIEWMLDQGIYEAHFILGAEPNIAEFNGDGSFIKDANR